jgi:SAM-dependent methyltransferase
VIRSQPVSILPPGRLTPKSVIVEFKLMARKLQNRSPAGWEPVADWYDGWMGQHGSQHHQQLTIPALLDLLQPQPGENILDLGCGQGVLAPSIADCGAQYTGIDLSRKMIAIAKQRHKRHGRYLVGDVRHLHKLPGIQPASYDAAVFLLSIEDMNPLDQVIKAAAWSLREAGRVVILMRHPCFRIPRQSGWGHDDQRKLRYRRVDHYLTPLSVPMKQHQRGVTISFHRPLSEYINALARHRLMIDRLEEIATFRQDDDKAARRADSEIPLFLGLRAKAVSVG